MDGRTSKQEGSSERVRTQNVKRKKKGGYIHYTVVHSPLGACFFPCLLLLRSFAFFAPLLSWLCAQKTIAVLIQVRKGSVVVLREGGIFWYRRWSGWGGQREEEERRVVLGVGRSRGPPNQLSSSRLHEDTSILPTPTHASTRAPIPLRA